MQSKWALHQTKQLLNNEKNELIFPQTIWKGQQKSCIIPCTYHNSYHYNYNNKGKIKVSITLGECFWMFITSSFKLYTSNRHTFLSAPWLDMLRHMYADIECTTFSGLRADNGSVTLSWWKLLFTLHVITYLWVANSVQLRNCCMQILLLFCTSQHYNAQRKPLCAVSSLWVVCVCVCVCVCVGVQRNVGVDVMNISPDLCEVSAWAGAECNNCSWITSSV